MSKSCESIVNRMNTNEKNLQEWDQDEADDDRGVNDDDDDDGRRCSDYRVEA